ncbi:MAG: hypothetical protein QM699_18880 [Amaricoccus sp.]|uniref:hypothetical protein n=1 Tax=Amaricoccus sp. TaxID=1872485 RepID=UPI0039E3051F
MRIGRLGRVSLILAGLAALTACDPSAMGAGLAGGSPTRARFDVGGAGVTIAAPPGWCLDPSTVRKSADGAFVLLTDCGLLGKPGATVGRKGAALTASISAGSLLEAEGDADTLADFQDFAGSREGRAVLGRSGEAARVRILATRESGGVYYVLVEDRGRLPIAGLDRQFWRAFFDVNGHTVALSSLGFTGESDAQAELNELATFARWIQAANGAKAGA